MWWTYPVARFFGHALYEYHYDINFQSINRAEQAEIQERNKILYKSYCNLVGSLVIMYAKDCDTTVYNVIKQMKSQADAQHNNQGFLNLLRAVYGIEHFIYTIMRYCGLFKLSCCEDMNACLMSTKLKMHTIHQQLARKLLLRYTDIVQDEVYKNNLRAVHFLKFHEFTLTKEMHLHGPYICQHGILLNCPPFSDSECDSIIKHAHSEFARINSVKKTIKSRYIKLVVSADKKDKTLEEAASMKKSSEKLPDLQNHTLSKLKSTETVLHSSGVTQKSAMSSKPEVKSTIGFHTPALVYTSDLFSTNPKESNRITLPTKDVEKFVLLEYDCRMKKHIAFQAASFALQNAKKPNKNLNNLIHQQRRFEEMWPSRRSYISPSFRIKEFFDENIFEVDIKIEELNMPELVKQAEGVIMLLRYTLEEL